jgi:hypothetical protein
LNFQDGDSEETLALTLPTDITISAGDRAVFAQNAGVITMEGWNELVIGTNLFAYTGGLNYTGDFTIRLKDASDEEVLIDEVRYQGAGSQGAPENACDGDGSEWPANVASNVASIGLYSPDLDNNCGWAWRRNSTASGIGGRPNRPNTPVYYVSNSEGQSSGPDLFITEVHWNPEQFHEDKEFVEIYNNHPNLPINLEGFELAGVNFTFTETIIQPGEYIMVVRCKQAGDTEDCDENYWDGLSNQVLGPWPPPPNSLSNSGERLRLKAPYGSAIAYCNMGDNEYGNGYLDVVANYPESSNTGWTLEYKLFCDENWSGYADCTEDCKNGGNSFSNEGNHACWQVSVNEHGTPGTAALPRIEGCQDETACNYDAEATIDNGTCEYAEANHDCDGNCIVDVDCLGDCGGSAVVDDCGVCNGGIFVTENSICCDVADCPGAAYDECSDNACSCSSGAPDCAGVCGGDSVGYTCGSGIAVGYDCPDGESFCTPEEEMDQNCSAYADGTCDCDGNIAEQF